MDFIREILCKIFGHNWSDSRCERCDIFEDEIEEDED